MLRWHFISLCSLSKSWNLEGSNTLVVPGVITNKVKGDRSPPIHMVFAPMLGIGAFLLRDAMQSAVMRLCVICPSVCNV